MTIAMRAPASIADYALLGDLHGAALLSRDGSVDWWCPSRFDAPAVFARLLDPDAGHWSVRPARPLGPPTRRYLDGTMVVETTLPAVGGRLQVTDALLLGDGQRGHELGRGSPHVLVRLLEAVDGPVEVDVELAPRHEYGLVTPSVTGTPTRVRIAGGPDRLTLTSTHPLTLGEGRVRGSLPLRAGETAVLALRHEPAHTPSTTDSIDGAARIADTVEGWRSWAVEHQSYRGPYADLVHRSGLVLQTLTYAPTGAVVAAPTTSLPEKPGGQANWDYRYGWLRDGSLTLAALWVAACPDEAERFFGWIVSSLGHLDPGRDLPIMFGVTGQRDLTEHRLDHLRGYRGSRPVRVGNDAWRQKQLDVLGEVMDCAWRLRDNLVEIAPESARLLRSVADRAAAGWQEADAGIWEGREGRRHYVTSKLMCWVALDRAVRLAPQIGADSGVERWTRARDEVRAAILEHGWSESAQSFVGAFGSDHLDAGVLLMPVVGFLPPEDDRVVATLRAIEKNLTRDGLVQRWTGAGDEGAFLICSYWLATARAMAGDVAGARALFETATSHANDLGLLAEEVDRRDGSLLGNFPQALSHIGLVNAAWAIAQAETS